jgi:intron-binding protein aquarius
MVQALNDIFEKIAVLNIHERHLLRLGHDADKLETEEDFSKWGRVQFMLGKRLELLGEVGRLAQSLNINAEVDYSCETAQHFYLFNVVARWEEYADRVKTEKEAQKIIELFPFHDFFSNAPAAVFSDKMSRDEAWIAAEGCFRHLQYMFTFLDECRAFEILRTYQERASYLVTTQAKIIAMTCTHAALKRHDFVSQGFEFDSLVMEESAQILEIETFIPMLLQQQHKGKPSRLKRVVLIGDHNQLPPVIKNTAFQKYSKMDQSLFTRFVRLGVPYIELNAQGRARPEMAKLYNWRYRALGDMEHVKATPRFLSANAGFAHEFQFVDVPEGVESEPTAYFYQNLVEAEYMVAVYMFMRLQGYPADKITMLSTYNGQVALLNDVARYRCSGLPEVGMPGKISTVDKYQGQQNDYILLSLVRSKTVGHLRDVRRLVVGLSLPAPPLHHPFAEGSLPLGCALLQRAFCCLDWLFLSSVGGVCLPGWRSIARGVVVDLWV